MQPPHLCQMAVSLVLLLLLSRAAAWMAGINRNSFVVLAGHHIEAHQSSRTEGRPVFCLNAPGHPAVSTPRGARLSQRPGAPSCLNTPGRPGIHPGNQLSALGHQSQLTMMSYVAGMLSRGVNLHPDSAPRGTREC